VSPNVKICVSSRPWQIFEVALKRTSRLRLQDLTKNDIAHYVNDNLIENKHMQQLCSVDPVGAPKLIEEIVEKAEGVFLWVILVVKSFLNGLRNGDSIFYLRKRLKEIPSEIKDLYTYMLSKIEPIYYEEGRRLFAVVWLAFYSENKYEGIGISAVNLFFAVREEHELIASDTKWDEKEVSSIVEWVESRFKVCCAGMMEVSSRMESESKDWCLVKPGNRSVQYIHRTARDFLAPGQGQKAPEWIRPVAADNIPMRMMRANMMYLKCLTAMEGNVSNDVFLIPIIQRTMWLAYKAEQESSHHHAELLDAFQDSAQRLFDFSRGWGNIVDDCIWGANARGHIKHSSFREVVWYNNFLCVAIMWKLGLYVENKLKDGQAIAKDGRPYLDYALRYMGKQGHPVEQWCLKTISVLLEHGSNPNQFYDFGTSSHYSDNPTPWKALLDAIANYSYTDHEDREEDFPSLLAPLMELMLSHGADPNASVTKGLHRWTVKDAVCQYSKSYPEKSAQLLKLIKTAAKKTAVQGSKPAIRPQEKSLDPQIAISSFSTGSP
jgi:hypothetical protein